MPIDATSGHTMSSQARMCAPARPGAGSQTRSASTASTIGISARIAPTLCCAVPWPSTLNICTSGTAPPSGMRSGSSEQITPTVARRRPAIAPVYCDRTSRPDFSKNTPTTEMSCRQSNEGAIAW